VKWHPTANRPFVGHPSNARPNGTKEHGDKTDGFKETKLLRRRSKAAHKEKDCGDSFKKKEKKKKVRINGGVCWTPPRKKTFASSENYKSVRTKNHEKTGRS